MDRLAIMRLPRFAAVTLFVPITLLGQSALSEPAAEALPKIVLVGDSIRLSYTPAVVKQLEGKAVALSPKANGVHLTAAARELLGKQVATFLSKHLSRRPQR